MEYKKKTKDKLIETALRMFHECGFENVGVRDIAAATGVTTGSFYHHFQGKDDVLHSIYEERDALFGKSLQELAENPPYCERILEFFLQDLTETVESDGVDLTAHRMFNMKIRSRESNELYKEMINLINKARANGEFQDKYDPMLINQYLFMVFRGVLYDWCIGTFQGEPEPLRNIMERGMTAAIRSFQI